MKKILGLLVIAVVILAGCGSKTTSDGLSGKIVVQAEGETYGSYFKAAAEAFTAETGVEVEIVDASMFDAIEALPTQKGNGPDVMLAPNDRVGELADQKLIAPLTTMVNDYTDTAKSAGNYKDAQYLLPMSTDTTLLIYNKDKIAETPKSIKELGADKFAAKFTDFYHAAGMFYDQGGYIFGDKNLDTTDVGLSTAEAIKAGEIFKSFYQSGNETWTLMQDDNVSYDVMMDAFNSGKVDAILNGPWALTDIAKAGINYGVAPIPSYDGTGTYSPLVGTKGMVVNAYSKNTEGAQAFVNFLNTKEYAQKWHEITKEVSPNTGVAYEEGSEAAIILDATTKGTSMPTDPAFGKVWGPMKDGLLQIAAGNDVKASLEAATKVIQSDIEGMKQ